MLSEYKKSHIKPLCTQLKSFNLYNDAGIDWLIECCKEKKQKSKDFYPLSSMMHFVMNAIYPLITLGIGLVLNNCTTNEVIEFIAVIIVMFLVGGGLIICLKPIVHSLLFFDEPIVDYLLDDLTYLKTQDKIEQIVRN